MGLGSVFSFGRRALIAGAVSAAAVFACGAREAAAGPITLTITVGATTFDVAAFTSGGTDTNYGTVDVVALNNFLATSVGSAYQFSSLGAQSNNTGTMDVGTLDLSGGIKLDVTGTGNSDITPLTITATQDGFLLPTGTTGTLASSSTGNFNGAGPGNSHTASSAYNALSTGGYDVTSVTANPDSQGNQASLPIGNYVTPYGLTNTITFNLTTDQATDAFGVSTRVSASGPAVPEPVSIVSLAFGLPLPVLAFALRKRRAALRQSA